MDNASGAGAGDVPCDSCSTKRALLHCAQHDARLCLTCDLHAHKYAHAHRRAPLCDGCHAAPAVARSDTQPFCAACARDGARQCPRRAATYTGVPSEAEMARILDTQPPPVTEEAWITDTLPLGDNSDIDVNYYPEMFEDANLGVGKEMMTGTTPAQETLLVDDANQQDYFQAWTNSFDSVALMEPGALQEPSYLDLEPSYLDFGSYLDPDQQMASSSSSDIAQLAMQSDSSLLQPLNMNTTPYVQLPMMDTNINNDILGATSSSLNLVELIPQSDSSLLQPLNMSTTPYVQLPMMDTNINSDIGATSSFSNLVELIPQSDSSLLQPLAMNDTLQPLTMNDPAYDQLPVIDTNTSNNASSEFPCVNFQSSNTGLLLDGNSMYDCQDQQASHVVLLEKPCPNPEKRQRAVQRYKQKRNNRRFIKQIMYASCKATADTRRRVRGRFVKASSSLEQGSSSNDNKQPKHEAN